ncbi:hypothetical protein FF38_11019, partial [Lucilia cuprina]
ADAAPRRGSGTITIVGPRSDLTTAEIRALREGVVPGRAVAPVEIAPDGTVAAFGAAGTGGTVPYAILSGHPREDLDLLGTSRIEVPLLAGPTFAMAREDWSAIGGFDGVSAGAAVPALSAALRARHISSSLDVPTVVVTCHPATGSPWSDNAPERFGPWSRQRAVLQPERPAPGCGEECSSREPHCILAVDSADVAGAALALIGGACGRRRRRDARSVRRGRGAPHLSGSADPRAPRRPGPLGGRRRRERGDEHRGARRRGDSHRGVGRG